MFENEKTEILQQVASSFNCQSYKVYPSSWQEKNGTTYCLVRLDSQRMLLCIGAANPFSGEQVCAKVADAKVSVKLCLQNSANAAILRKIFPWTAPTYVGLQSSFGSGDRLGIATPGHIRALKSYAITPVLAQQSIRELTRTQRKPEDVIDAATWAVFQEGYEGGYGSDADHLKTEADIRSTVQAGFTGFTIDPSDHINDIADSMSTQQAELSFQHLFANAEEADAFLQIYAGRKFPVQGQYKSLTISFSEPETERLAIKYLSAIYHTISAFHLLQELMKDREFDFEMSVDETSTPTTPAAHYFVADQLTRAGVRLTSLAPRFIGDFQKAIDYIGDLNVFSSQLRDHVAIAQSFGGYKISVHSGSDKFSIFPIIGQETGGFFHEKTAGTSYLEALRIISRHNPDLFRGICSFAREKFEQERHSYHVTTDMTRVPDANSLPDSRLESMLDENDSRQVLHITFGSTLTSQNASGDYLFRNEMFRTLDQYEEEYYHVVKDLIEKHLQAFNVHTK
jgi:tagaturonate epimerase